MVERLICFGTLYEYTADNQKIILVCYMDANSGMVFKDKASKTLIDRIKELDLKSGDMCNGLFSIDAFNKCTLTDIKLS